MYISRVFWLDCELLKMELSEAEMRLADWVIEYAKSES